MLSDRGILIFNKEAKKTSGVTMSALDKNSILPPALSDYLDYRLFLQDFYHYKKELTKNDLRPYSYQLFSAAANIKSPNYLKMIIEGQRNLSDDMILKFAKALSLNKEQTEEFLHLVKLNQAEDTTERNVYLKKLSEVRINQKLKSGEIDRRIWEKIPNWVAWVIYAMIDQEGVSFDVQSLKALLRNKASDQEIESALNSLISSGEIRKDPVTGEMKRSHNLIDSAEEIPVALVRKLQMQLMYIGLESLYQEAPQEREFGTLTLSLTKEEFEETKFKLRQLRKSLNKDNAIARKEKKGERIYQINIQLFPVTDVAKTDALTVGKAVHVDQAATPVKKSVQDLAEEAMKAANLFETEGQI